MVLGKLSVPGRLTNFDKSRARAYSALPDLGKRIVVAYTYI